MGDADHGDALDAGVIVSAFSPSTLEMFSPPLMKTSFLRSLMEIIPREAHIQSLALELVE